MGGRHVDAGSGAVRQRPAQSTPPADEAASESDDEIVVTAQRRNENLMTTPTSASVLRATSSEHKGVTNVDALQFAMAERGGQQFRPGQRLQRARHRQGRAQHPDDHRRDHLSRRRPVVPGLCPDGALLRRQQHPGAARAAGHDRRPRTRPAAQCSSTPTIRSSAAASTAISTPITATTNDAGRAGRAQPAGQRQLRGARRIVRRAARRFLETSPAPAARPIRATTATCGCSPAG